MKMCILFGAFNRNTYNFPDSTISTFMYLSTNNVAFSEIVFRMASIYIIKKNFFSEKRL